MRTNLLLPNLDPWPAHKAIIELRDVVKSYAGERVIDGLTMTVMPGKTTVIAGESGSGKSVLLRLMNGLTQPDEGEVLLFGENLATCGESRRTELRKRCTMVFQNYALIDSMTVAQNVGFPLSENTKMPPDEIRTRVLELLTLLEIHEAIDRFPASLSGGMKKRVAFARAVITNPEVVLFDEPTTGLDPIMIEFVDNLIIRTQKEFNLTSVIISHDMASNRRLADNIAVLHNGRIVDAGSVGHIMASAVPSVRRFLADAPRARLSTHDDVVVDDTVPVESPPAIRIHNLNKSFGSNHVLRDITVDIPARKISVIIGASGSGKSVLVKHITGLFRPDTGQVTVLGRELSALDTADLHRFRSEIGMLFQGAALFDSMTVGQNIGFALQEAHRRPKSEILSRVTEVAERLQVVDILDAMPSEISNGQKKRVALARALITKPKIMIYDEPTTGQDPIMMRRVDDMIVEASHAFDITSIVISHDMISTFRIAHRILMIHEGRLLIADTPERVRASEDPRVQRFIFAGSDDSTRPAL